MPFPTEPLSEHAPLFHIRPYDASRDAGPLREAFIELQEAERGIDPFMPPGEEIADAYLAKLLDQCDESAGCIYLAVDARSGQLAGYVAVLGRVESDEPDDDPSPYAYLSDLVVCASFRGHGLATRLVAEAERHAREHGMGRIRLQMLARNEGARRLYERAGFEAHIVTMEKRF